MLQQLKSVLTRSSATIAQDVIGATALVVMLFVGLHLPYLT